MDGNQTTNDTLDESREVRTAGVQGIPGQGPFMLMVLSLQKDRVVDAKFQTYGCPAAVACGNFVTEWLVNKSVVEASSLDVGDILAGVGQMPLGREHCPVLAINSLRNALANIDAARSK